MNEKDLNVSLFAIRRLALRGVANSEGRSAVGVGETQYIKEGSDIKDSLGTGLKIRSQGFVKLAIRRNSCQTVAVLDIFSSSTIHRVNPERIP